MGLICWSVRAPSLEKTGHFRRLGVRHLARFPDLALQFVVVVLGIGARREVPAQSHRDTARRKSTASPASTTTEFGTWAPERPAAEQTAP